MDQGVFTFFKPGQPYQPTHSFKRLGSVFHPEDRVVFQRVTFSHYDEVYIYSFIPARGGKEKIWFPLSGEGEEACKKYFTAAAGEAPIQLPEPTSGPVPGRGSS